MSIKTRLHAPGPAPSKGAGRVGKIAVLIFLGGLALALGGGRPRPAAAGVRAPETPPAGVTLDFEGYVHLALRQSPYLLKSALEIDIRRLDEADSRYALTPPVSFSTRYYVNRPTARDLNPRPYSLSFTTEGYNPLEAYFSLQAKKLLTQIAVLAHLKVLSKGLHRLGRCFLELDTLKNMAPLQRQVVDLARENLAYVQNRLSLGEASSLEARLAVQELEVAQAEGERLKIHDQRLRENLKAFLGKSPPPIQFDLSQVRRQVLGGFDPAAATLEQARSRSLDLKIQALKKELQAQNILLAKTKLLPTLFLGVQTPDPLSLVDARGYYFSVGLNLPVWDGFKRARDISRQKTILRQFNAEEEEMGLDLGSRWREGQEVLSSTAVALKLARAQEELAQLKERQGEICYRTGGEPLPVYLEGRRAALEARKNTAAKILEYDQAVLGLRYLSGDLGKTYVAAAPWRD